jgi:putative FmdB family regulatory protein
MPIYEYRCGSCGHELEALQKFSDSPLKQCPSCGRSHLHKLVSAAGFQLKGSGWYATDFKNSGKPAEKKNGKGDATSAASDAKTDSSAKSESTAKSDSAASDSTTASKSETKAASGGGGCGSGCSCH